MVKTKLELFFHLFELILLPVCLSADEAFCEMVKSNRLCEKRLYRQFCCRTCPMNG